MNKLIGIAGGSGSGKSTLAILLVKKYPEKFTLVQLDDYYKRTSDAPKLPDGGPNWDNPAALRFDDLYSDLQTLLKENSIEVWTKSEFYNPEYRTELKNRIWHTIEPKPVVVLEGNLALYDERIRGLMNFKIYLDMPIEESLKRRSVNKFFAPEGYFEHVLIPAHKEFVESAKQYADLVVGVSNSSQEELFAQVEEAIKDKK
ncbi:MAG: uridine kinase [Parcubacteria group bacterium Gr01-1014_56]|nr:MAG: uridine kinase [Parcubacteria group bacterium Gr01-1014_56]